MIGSQQGSILPPSVSAKRKRQLRHTKTAEKVREEQMDDLLHPHTDHVSLSVFLSLFAIFYNFLCLLRLLFSVCRSFFP